MTGWRAQREAFKSDDLPAIRSTAWFDIFMNTHTRRTEIRAPREPWLCDTISIRLAQISNMDGVRTVAMANPLTLTVKTEEELGCEQEATMRLQPDEAQQFMDELWRVGIRPTEGAGSVGQMAATERHLEDMRKIAFHNLSNSLIQPN